MNLKEAREIIKYLWRGSFEFASGFLEGYEAGVREAANLMEKQYEEHFEISPLDAKVDILKLLDEGKPVKCSKCGSSAMEINHKTGDNYCDSCGQEEKV